MASLLSMVSTTGKVLQQFKMRDQPTGSGNERNAMRIGTIDDDKQGFWVSYDPRGKSEHSRFWDDDGSGVSSAALKSRVRYAKGLELEHFKAKKSTTAHQPQRKKRADLIRMIYHQGGYLYEGDVQKIEAIYAEKDQRKGRKSKKEVKNTTPRKTQNTSQDPDGIIRKFITNASSLPKTLKFAQKLEAIMKHKLSHNTTPPTNVIHEALIEAHKKSIADARLTLPYTTWELDHSQPSTRDDEHSEDDDESSDDDDESSDEDDEGNEGDMVNYGKDGDEGDGDDESSDDDDEGNEGNVVDYGKDGDEGDEDDGIDWNYQGDGSDGDSEDDEDNKDENRRKGVEEQGHIGVEDDRVEVDRIVHEEDEDEMNLDTGEMSGDGHDDDTETGATEEPVTWAWEHLLNTYKK